MTKRAPADHPIHDLIAERWSPVVYSDEDVAPADLRSLLEAARWAASSFNEQPWSYLVGTRGDAGAYDGILGCLVEANQAWARRAPVLMLSVAATTFERNGKPNRHAWHDVGQASAHLSLQAVHLGLFVHQMAGFSADRARERFSIPEGREPVACLAVGRLGEGKDADEKLVARDAQPRERRPLEAFVFGDGWQVASPVLEDAD